jgi:D-alanine-D-alanine ligase-like ATP-grasp enzyme
VHKKSTGWIELTVGLLERNGHYHALSPSITVAQGAVLSLEEKFQGGTGVNLTPPPLHIITAKQLDLIKTKIEQAAKTLGIQGYARIDIFFNTSTDQTMLIEANSLPGLTPSTVIYHQALAEDPPLTPQVFLSKLVEYGLERRALDSPENLRSASVSTGTAPRFYE